MGTRTVIRSYYHFKKPENPISKLEFNRIKSSPIEFYPQQQSPFMETFKEYPGDIIFFVVTSFTVFLPLMLIILGSMDESWSYYKMIKVRNQFFYNLYKTIYDSDNYEQFLSNYEKI